MIDYLKQHLLTCPMMSHFHIPCPGCGFQRSLIALLEGHWALSIRLYPALLPLLGLWFFTGVHLFAKFKQGGKIIIFWAIGCGILILISYFHRLVTQQV
jgi:hypothetical protein